MDYKAAASELLGAIMAKHRTDFFGRIGHMKGEGIVLHMLTHSGAFALPSEISAATGHSSARIAMVLKNLEKKGLITREMDRNDRRKILVSVTKKGEEAIRTQREGVLEGTARVLEAMGEEDAREFVRTHIKFMSIFEEMSHHRGDWGLL